MEESDRQEENEEKKIDNEKNKEEKEDINDKDSKEDYKVDDEDKNKEGDKDSKEDKGEEVCEIFEVEKAEDKDEDGGANKKEVKRVCELAEKKHASKEQMERHNKILRNLFIGLGVGIIVIVLGVIFLNYVRKFEYKGVEFEIIKYCDSGPCLVLYQTSIPVIYNGNKVPYNFYLRRDPRDSDVNFDVDITFLKDVVLNMTGDLNCDGDGVIAIANLVKFYEVIGASVIKDGNASCDAQGRYTFVKIKEGNETSVEQTGSTCYTLNVNNCEILDVTEKLMVESFVELKDYMKY